MFKICVIGCGNMSKSGHGPSFAKYKKDYKDVCLAACCDLDEEKAKSYMEAFGFECYYTDYKKMLEEIKPDVVSLICPVDFTCPISVEIMKMGINIIMEKPPGKNRQEIEIMDKAAKEYGVNVRTAFNRRYTPLILELIKRVRATGEKIINITYQLYRYHRFDKDFSTTSIHAVDVVKQIAGCDYETVNLSYDNHTELGENVKNIFLDGKFENGAFFQISLVPTGGAITERVTVNTVNHSFFVDLPMWENIDVPGKLLQVTENNKCQVVSGDELCDSTDMYEVSGFYDENRLFFEHLRNYPNDIINDLQTAVQSVEIEDCIRHSVTKYEKKKADNVFDFTHEEFSKFCQMSHETDDGYYGDERARLLGFTKENISIAPGAIINCKDKNKIGKNVRIGLYTYISGDVTIGDNAMIGPHCSLPAGNHKFDTKTGWFSSRTERDYDNGIVVGEGSWLASNVTVTAGVKIGKCNLICAGAVVTKSTEDYAIMAGIPAKKIGYINKETGEYVYEK